MDNQSNNIAVLFFSRSAKAEARHKQFLRHQNTPQNTQIANTLISHTYRQIQKSGLPCYHIDETQQVGHSFGERFAHAFQQVFDDGFDYVISVGNDIPQLRAHHIKHAAEQLQSGNAEMVLGPDADGGTWLMGYSKQIFDIEQFLNLPWNTDRLLEVILEQSSGTSTKLLETFSDIDDPRALQIFAQSRYNDNSLLKLARELQSILSICFCHSAANRQAVIRFPFLRIHSLRAPPLI